MEENISWLQLVDELRKAHYEIEVCLCHYEKYLEWVQVNREDVAHMREIGKVVNDNRQEQSGPTVYRQDQYWGKDAKMAFGSYPYYGCMVHKCVHCQRLFFVYREMGGHAAEVRYRYIREELMVFETANYSASPVLKTEDERELQHVTRGSEYAQKQPPGSSIKFKPLIWLLIVVFIVRVVSCLAGSGH
jgi:hypothetical protein